MSFKPMLADKIEDISKLSFPLYASPKLDGIRIVIPDGVPLTRKLKAIRNVFIREYIETHFSGYKFDGEIMIPDKDFNGVQSAVMNRSTVTESFVFHVFDLIHPDDPFSWRYRDLRHYIEKLDDDKLKYVQQSLVHDVPQLLNLEQLYLEMGYEGVMVRQVKGGYKFGRSTVREGHLLKLKRFHDAEATIIGFEERMRNTNEQTRDELGRSKRSSKREGLVPAGTLGALIVKDILTHQEFNIGTGFDDATRLHIWNNRKEFQDKTITYTYQELSSYGVPRFPVYKGIRND